MRPDPAVIPTTLRTVLSAVFPWLCGLLLLVSAVPAVGARLEVLRIRYWTAPDHTRVVLDLSGSASYEVRRIKDPERLAINVRQARFRSRATIPVGDGLVQRIRRNELSDKVQVVLDLQKDVTYRHFFLPAADGRPCRIVVDISRPVQQPRHRPTHPPAHPPELLPTPFPAPQKVDPARPFTVILDPGHGGMDPGAVRHGTKEKEVVLTVAREAARLFNQIPGYHAVLTRERDYFLSLAQRVQIAQEKEGDLFISVHANTHPKRSTAGMEVYFLSLKGATDREARELANKENAADMVGLAPDGRESDSVITILMDLHMTRILYNSSRLAEHILMATDHMGVVGTRRVKQARFQVLCHLAMPSALVELAYLSNSQDRKLLAAWSGQRRLAASLVAGVLSYRDDQAALALLTPGLGWSQTYQVRSGDSLWKLARRYGTTVTEIRQQNNLRSSSLRIGQELRLPHMD